MIKLNRQLLLVILLIGVFPILANAELILEYKNQTIMLPNSNETINVFVANTESDVISADVFCYSELDIECPSSIEIQPNGVSVIPIRIKTGYKFGDFPIHFSLGNFTNGTIIVKISTVPGALDVIIRYYEDAIERLKENPKAANLDEVRDVETKLNVARELWKSGLYYECINKLEEVQEGVEKAAEAVAKLESEETTTTIREEKKSDNIPLVVQVLFFLIPLPLVVLAAYYFMYKINKGSEKIEVKPFSDLLEVRRIVGRPKRKLSVKEPDIRTIEKRIESLKRRNEDVSSLEVDLMLVKKLKREGRNLLAEKYLKKLAKRLEWDLGG